MPHKSHPPLLIEWEEYGRLIETAFQQGYELAGGRPDTHVDYQELKARATSSFYPHISTMKLTLPDALALEVPNRLT